MPAPINHLYFRHPSICCTLLSTGCIFLQSIINELYTHTTINQLYIPVPNSVIFFHINLWLAFLFICLRQSIIYISAPINHLFILAPINQSSVSALITSFFLVIWSILTCDVANDWQMAFTLLRHSSSSPLKKYCRGIFWDFFMAIKVTKLQMSPETNIYDHVLPGWIAKDST